MKKLHIMLFILAALAMASCRTKAHDSGPMERTVTDPPCASRICKATSKADRSKGLRSLESDERVTRLTDGRKMTDLIQTMMCSPIMQSL